MVPTKAAERGLDVPLNFTPEDALQRRISRFVGGTDKDRALNGAGEVWLGTTLGLVRKQNQDRALFLSATYSANPTRNYMLAVLCDGIGGMEDGSEAAQLALSAFVSRVIRTSRAPLLERLRSCAFISNHAVYRRFAGRGGSTLAAVAAIIWLTYHG